MGSWSVKRKIRRAVEMAMPLLGMGIIFASVLGSPDNLQIQVLLVLAGILILEAGVWRLTNALLPNERRYMALREEGDHFLGLIRALNEAAIARDSGVDDGARFRDTRSQMHISVDRMAEVAGEDAIAIAEAAAEAEAATKAVAAKEAAATEAVAPNMVGPDGATTTEIPAPPADRGLDPARPNA